MEDSSDTTIDESRLDVPKRARTGRAFLTLMSGDDAGETHRIELGETSIGRDPEADVTLRRTDVSRRHAKIVCDSDHTAKVVDLQSRNGTFVNGTPVTVEVLRDGDRVRIGKHVVFAFRYEYARAEGERPAEAEAEAVGDTMVDAEDDGLSHHERAIAHYERTLEMREQRLGRRDPSVAEVLDRMGEVLRSLGDYDGAIARHERARSILEEAPGASSRALGQTLINLGECHLARDAHAEAVEVLERALALYESFGAGRSELAWPRFALARALHAAGRDLDRVRDLAGKAREGFAGGTADARMMVSRVDGLLELAKG